eukprot:s1714_g5.t1
MTVVAVTIIAVTDIAVTVIAVTVNAVAVNAVTVIAATVIAVTGIAVTVIAVTIIAVTLMQFDQLTEHVCTAKLTGILPSTMKVKVTVDLSSGLWPESSFNLVVGAKDTVASLKACGLTCLDLPARFTAVLPALELLWLVICLAFFPVVDFVPGSCSGLTCSLHSLSLRLLPGLCFKLDLLLILCGLRGPTRNLSPTPSVGSFEVLSEPPAAPSVAPSRGGLETRDQILASFAACPPRLLALGNKLFGANLSGRDRADRAWVAGQWARAVLDSRVHSPNRTPPLDLRSRFYAVARADSVDCPVVFRSSSSYWRAIGSLEGSSSVSQSFPSESEARIYLLAAGFSEDSIQFLP